MDRDQGRGLAAKVGAVLCAWALVVPVVLIDAATPGAEVRLAGVVRHDAMPGVAIAVTPATTSSFAVATTIADLADVPQLPVARAVLAYAAGAVADPPPAPRPALPPAPPKRAEPPPEALIREGIVLASWYGPRFYGRKTACGQTYTPEIIGVAHRVLRCGTLITITSPRGVTLTVPVIDRGPYIAGRALDLSNATRLALQCTDLCHVRMKVLE
jgi:hypothetical protein